MYTPQQAATVFSVIRKTLLMRPHVFKREGLFRISGDHVKAQEIINGILSRTNSIHLQHTVSDALFPAYDHISALKIILDDKESYLLNPKNPDIAKLKDFIETHDENEAADELEQFVHRLIMSEDQNQHAMGEVLYTYLQLARLTLNHEHLNKMSAQNLGIVLGPNFEKMLNTDPYKMLPLIHKLNTISAILLMRDTYKEDFEHKYARHIIQMKNSKLAQLKQQQQTLHQMSAFYQERIEEFKDKLATEKSQATIADRKNRKLLRARIISDEKTMSSYQIVSQDGSTDKLVYIQAQIDELNRDIEELINRYPDRLKSSLETRFERLSIITHEIDELISDDEEALDSPLRMSNNLLMKSALIEFPLTPKASDHPEDVEYTKSKKFERPLFLF